MSRTIEELKEKFTYPEVIQEIINFYFEKPLDTLLNEGYVVTKIYFRTDADKEYKFYAINNFNTKLTDNGYNVFDNGAVGLAPSSRGKNQADLYMLLANNAAFTIVKDCYRAGVYKPAFLELYKEETKETSFLAIK